MLWVYLYVYYCSDGTQHEHGVDQTQSHYDHDQQVLDEVREHNDKLGLETTDVQNYQVDGQMVDSTEQKVEGVIVPNEPVVAPRPKLGFLRITLVSNITNQAYLKSLEEPELIQPQPEPENLENSEVAKEADPSPDIEAEGEGSSELQDLPTPDQQDQPSDQPEQILPTPPSPLITIDDPYVNSIADNTLETYHTCLPSSKIPLYEPDFNIDTKFEPKGIEDYVPKEYDDEELEELKAINVYKQVIEYDVTGKHIK